MEGTIGEKIKKLRKELKLTQAELTGNEMTKSMLSQIENNLATPSMKNLKYLAERLEKPISFFLEEDYQDNTDNQKKSYEELPLEEINERIKSAEELSINWEFEKSGATLEKILEDYSINEKTKLYADILTKIAKVLALNNEIDRSEDMYREAFKVYEYNHLYSDAARAYMGLYSRVWQEHDYESCLNIINEAHKIYQKEVNKDTSFEIEYLYEKAVVISAMENIEETIKTLNQAIQLSSSTQVYYMSDELYRLLANMYLMTERYDSYLYNVEKARQFAQFTENRERLGLIEFSLALYENEMNNPKKALEYLELASMNLNQKNYLYYNEKAKSYYLLGRYKEAMDIIKKSEYPDFVHHTFDFLLLWSSKVYEGLILFRLGEVEKSIESINMAIKKMKTRPQSKFLALAYKSLSEIYSELEDFEKAFKNLKKANEIQSKLKEVPY